MDGGFDRPIGGAADPAAELERQAAAREEIRRAMAPFMPPDTRQGVLHFCLDAGLYLAALAGVLFLPGLLPKIACSLFAGLKVANLATLGHDAAHGNLTASKRLNAVLGVACFMPALFNWRLWIYDHHHVHHPYTNGSHTDSWVPLSKPAFDALPAGRRLRERLYRSSWGLGLAPYYIIERWWAVKFFPRAFLPARFRAAAWRHFAGMTAYLAGFLGLLAAAPLYSPTGSATAILLGFALPFYVWMTLYSFTVYVQHTHARIPWFDGPVDRRTAMPQEVLTLHLEFPRAVKFLVHNVYDHAAHHVNVRIPFHRLADAQRRLNEIVGEAAVVQPFSLRWLHETLRDCRLYDYQAHRWLDFEGRPTAPPAVSERQLAEIARRPGTVFVRAA